MHIPIQEILWRQFGASIDMLQNAINFCPESNWDTDKKFWYHAYHCVFFLDYYLTLRPAGFEPPKPYSLSEFEDRMPERTYTKEELSSYLQFCRSKCKNLITSLTEEVANGYWVNESGTMKYPVIEILMYNMRHVQHHAAQLNLLLRQEIDDAPEWVFEAIDPLK